SSENVDWGNVVLWVIGFILYQVFLALALPIGSTIPVVVLLIVLSIIVHKVTDRDKSGAAAR
ncbi:MAG: hypothetical protein ACI364_02280, partial [Coriobacteriales bacterium]